MDMIAGRLKAWVCVFIFFAVCVNGCHGQIKAKFDTLFQRYHDYGLFEGVALIADHSGVIFEEAYGLANHELNIANSPKTIFRIGSLEKQFTAMLVMQLVGKGELVLENRINEYLPEYRKDIGSKVTIHQLLTHTSGIPSYTALPNVWEDSMKLAYSPQYILQNFCSNDLEFKPGSQYKYGNSNYFILAMIIERVTGKTFSTVLQQNILDVVGMTRTGIDKPTAPSQAASGYLRLGSSYIKESYIFAPNAKGSASMFSTAYDLYLWNEALKNDKLLSEPLLRTYLSPHYRVAPGYSYGYGWEFVSLPISATDPIKAMQHSGAIRAFRSLIIRIPNEHKCIIMISNCASESGYDLAESVLKIFRGEKPISPKRLLADTLFTIYQKEGISNAIKQYQQLKLEHSAKYDFNSYSLEWFGERLLLMQSFVDAAAVFALAVTEFPDYTYGFLYLGRAYEKAGRRDLAISAYQKAVEKDKNSRPGRDAAFQLKYLLDSK